MADDVKSKPAFEISNENVTHLNGERLPPGLITMGSSLTSAKPASPDQSEWAINGAYDFAERLRKP